MYMNIAHTSKDFGRNTKECGRRVVVVGSESWSQTYHDYENRRVWVPVGVQAITEGVHCPVWILRRWGENSGWREKESKKMSWIARIKKKGVEPLFRATLTLFICENMIPINGSDLIDVKSFIKQGLGFLRTKGDSSFVRKKGQLISHGFLLSSVTGQSMMQWPCLS